MVHFRGTEAETKICPRRHAINNGWVFSAHELYRQTDGKLGVAFLAFTNKMVESMSVVEDALGWRKESEDG